MADTSKLTPRSRRERAYYKQRQRNLQFEAILSFLAEEAKLRDVSKKELADYLGKDPAQITRWLRQPSNFETDTITELLLPFDAEMEHRVVRFSERGKSNYMHPVVARVISKPPPPIANNRLSVRAQTGSVSANSAVRVLVE